MARGFKIADAYVELSVDKDDLRKAVRDLPRDSGSDLDRSGRSMGQRLGKSLGDESSRQGRGVGDKLSMGIRMSVIRNSPLIAAAVAGGLTAGTPLLLAAATTMFAGVGVAAATQSLAVRSAWRGTWDDIKRGAYEDSGAIERVLVGMAGKVSDGFERMRPALRNAFDAAAPQLDRFTDSLIRAGENALPGLVRAVQAGSPVMEGFGRFMESIGTGLGDMFDVMAENSQAAGETFTALGEIIGRLLPILGSLMGMGAQLGSVILPPLASILGVVADVLADLGPVLPAVVAGFAAMKIAQSAAGWVGGLGNKLNGLKSAFTAGNVAAAGLGVVIAGIAADFANTKTEVDRWSNALLQGGSAAAAVRQEYEGSDYLLRSLDEWTGLAGSIEEAEAEMRAMLAAMTPLERASTLLTQAENDLAYAIEEHGASSDEAAAANRRYESAARELERQESVLEDAIHGVTSAMIEQADQALAAIDSGFAYRKSIDDLEDAQVALNEAIAEHGPKSEAAQRAQLSLEEQTFRTAAAYAQQQADLSGLSSDSLEYKRIVQQELLAELYRLHDAAGPEMRAAIGQQIAALERSGVKLDEVAAKASSGTGQLQRLGQQRPTPVVRLDSSPFSSVAHATATRAAALGAMRLFPVVNLRAYTDAAERALNYTARNRYSTVTQTVKGSSVRSTVATGGRLGDVPVKRFSDGGKVVGPGGPTEDRVGPFFGQRADLFFSNDEWVIRAMAANKYGDRLMKAVNDGTATITAPDDRGVRGLARGGSVSVTSRASSLAGTELHFHLHNVDIHERREARRYIDWVQQELIKRERELH